MSTTATPAAAFDAETAYGLITQRVYAPIMFQKVAEYGIQPRNEEEAQRMLVMAAQLRAGYEQQQEKQATARTSPLDRAEAHLHGRLKQAGLQVPSHTDGQIKQAAWAWAAEPDVVRAVLSLQAAAAQAAQ